MSHVPICEHLTTLNLTVIHCQIYHLWVSFIPFIKLVSKKIAKHIPVLLRRNRLPAKITLIVFWMTGCSTQYLLSKETCQAVFSIKHVYEIGPRSPCPLTSNTFPLCMNKAWHICHGYYQDHVNSRSHFIQSIVYWHKNRMTGVFPVPYIRAVPWYSDSDKCGLDTREMKTLSDGDALIVLILIYFRLIH